MPLKLQNLGNMNYLSDAAILRAGPVIYTRFYCDMTIIERVSLRTKMQMPLLQ